MYINPKHLVCHCTAENLGASLFVDRSEFEILFLRSGPDHEFLTGDQPIVNLYGAISMDSPPTETALYYPLKPHLSMILLPKMCGLTSMKVPPIIVDQLNILIARKAREFLVARRMESLERMNSGLQERQLDDGHVLLGRIKNVATRGDEYEEETASLDEKLNTT